MPDRINQRACHTRTTCCRRTPNRGAVSGSGRVHPGTRRRSMNDFGPSRADDEDYDDTQDMHEALGLGRDEGYEGLAPHGMRSDGEDDEELTDSDQTEFGVNLNDDDGFDDDDDFDDDDGS